MKKWLILLVCLSSGRLRAGGAGRSPFEDDYYAEYMDGDYDVLHELRFPG